MAKALLSTTFEGSVLAKYPVSVKAVIRKGGKFLMIRGTRKGDSEWSFPGGLVDEGESLEEALKREVLEETGYEVRVGNPFYATKYRHPNGGENVAIFYACEVVGGSPSLGGEPDQEFIALEWVSPQEAVPWARKVMERAP